MNAERNPSLAAPAPVRLIALDLDGTLLDDHKQLSRRTIQALTEAGKRGVWVVPATGRTASGIPAELLALPGVRYAITANGARVLDLAENRCLYQKYIPYETALAAYEALKKYDCMVDLFQDGQGYTTPGNVAQLERFVPENLREYVRSTRVCLEDMGAFVTAQRQGLEKFTLFFGSETDRQAAWTEMENLGLQVVSSLPGNMELTADGADKGAGLLALAKELGLPRESLMACGDGGNDAGMLAAAGVGVAMANAMPAAKQAARFTTASNNEDGVARAVEKLVLSGQPAPSAPPIRLAALDLDGTLLDQNSHVTPCTRAAIAEAVQRGLVVVPATGRGLSGLPMEVAGLPGVRYVLTTNGGSVWDLGQDPEAAVRSRYGDPKGRPTAEPRLLLCRRMSPELARKVYGLLKQYPGDLSIFSQGHTIRTYAGLALARAFMAARSTEARQEDDGRFTLFEELDGWMEQNADTVEKFCLFTDSAAAAGRVLDALRGLEGVELVQGAPDNVEVTAAGVDKGSALLALADTLGIPREQVLAIGDSGNDRAMLKAAGLSVAMANAPAEIQALAGLVTARSCNEDGVAELLERLGLC